MIVSYRILGKNNSSVEIATQSFSKTQFSKQIAKPETQPILLASTGNNLGGLLAQQNLEDLFEQPTQAIDDFVNKEMLFAEKQFLVFLPTHCLFSCRKWQFLVFLPTHCLFSCQNSLEFRSQLTSKLSFGSRICLENCVFEKDCRSCYF